MHSKFVWTFAAAASLGSLACDDALTSGGADAGRADAGGDTSTGGNGNTGGSIPSGGSAGGAGGSNGGSTGGATGGASGGAGGSAGGSGGSGGQTPKDDGGVPPGPDLGGGGAGGGPPCVPADESCNGLDDNCDGLVDNGVDGEALREGCYDGQAGSLEHAPCAEGTHACRQGMWQACEGQVLPGVEICDLADNDCDGDVDDLREGSCACDPGTSQACYSGPAGTENQGVCVAGRQICPEEGVAWGPCEGLIVPAGELCDGLDNDCNGLADDALPGAGGACQVGMGACAAMGALVCDPVAGELQCDAAGGVGAGEVCNGRDDDCDGASDEDVGAGGPCSLGVGACEAAGLVRCRPELETNECDAVPGQPVAELCDGLDNDCNGAVDEGNPEGGSDCVTGQPGACAPGGLACEGGALVCQPRTLPADEACNGVDDDCDGAQDEGPDGGPLVSNCYDGPDGTLDVGACRPGRQSCDAGGFTACEGAVVPDVEVCNGLDDDCNGTIDDAEGVGTPCGLGQGACEAAGVILCDGVAESLYCNAVPGDPGEERCNGLDDDCNGVTDDTDIRVAVMGGDFYTDHARAYLDGLPNITATENRSCEPVNLARYDAIVVYGNMVCADDVAFSEYVQGGGGLIGTPWVVANNNSFAALPVVDPGDSQYEIALDLTIADPDSPLLNLVNFDGSDGLCTPLSDPPHVGDVDCIGYNAPITLREGAHLVATHDAVPGGIAIADWDYGAGRAVYLDFHYITEDTATVARYPWGRQLLRNAVEQVTGCPAGPQLACPEGHPGPAPEACNGVDDDCDGTIDNLPDLGQACTSGLGACRAAGVTVCVADRGVVCSAEPGAAQPESCNGVDDNCDGAVDDGNPGGGQSCGTGNPGVCAAGVTACTNATVVCNQSVNPGPETCNGRDDNCNGATDDGDPGGGAACNTGLAGVCSAGVNHCVNGGIACTQNVQPAPEQCNGRDDNCNGQSDEGNPGGGAACNTGVPGACSTGARVCSNGSLVCAQSVQPGAEACNGRDDDCNGTVDNGNPGGGQACNTGQLGICAAGTTACTNGGIACNANQAARAESCNNLDDDCNGVIDNGGVCLNIRPLFADGPGYACPTGATTWNAPVPVDPNSSAHAQLACEACYGAGACFLENADCAGPGWGPRPPGQFQSGEAYFGYTAGCSGATGRVWAISHSFDTYGYWSR